MTLGTRPGYSVDEAARLRLRMIADGLTDREIAARLCSTREKVAELNRRLYVFLGAKNRAHAVTLAYQRGLLHPSQNMTPPVDAVTAFHQAIHAAPDGILSSYEGDWVSGGADACVVALLTAGWTAPEGLPA